ncbi:MAG: polysulfide reductase NrfD [Deltaproteobacteria bacterium]|nr:polysulfide reductase NrfD [Deltaproteobacteria bacterium]
MSTHVEIESTRSLAGALDPYFWGWEIPVYLMLGGLVAGLMVVVSSVVLLRGREAVTPSMRSGLAMAPALLGLGMVALFLDLTQKVHVFRFYIAFRPSSPMSWGSWLLLLVMPLQLALVLALPAPWLEPALERASRWKSFEAVREWILARTRPLAWVATLSGASLGVYTGILLSTTVGRPLWSSGALGALFLISGVSTGIALLMLLERDRRAHQGLARAEVAFIAIELLLIGLWLSTLLTQGPAYREAAASVMRGPVAPLLFGFVVFGGLLVPMSLEVAALRGRARASHVVPLLVLLGGFLLRVVVVYGGQAVGFAEA